MGRTLDSTLSRYINVATLVSLIASVLTIYFFVGALNRNAERNDRRLLSAGIEATTRQNEIWVTDYGWWGEVLTLWNEQEERVLTGSLSSSFSDHGAFDFVALSSTDNVDGMSWHRDTGSQVRTDVLTHDDIAALRADLAAAYEQGRYIATHFLDIGGIPYLASVTVMGEYDDRASMTDPMKDPIIVLGAAMDDDFLTATHDVFLVSGAALHDGAMPRNTTGLELRDDNGHLVGWMSWQASRPGLDTLRLAFIPLLAYIAIFFVGAQLIAHKARTLARHAENNEKRAVIAAGTDNLSGLPNRLGFTSFIESGAARQAAGNGEAAVIYIDLNGFKAVNDKAGHRAGDDVIRRVAHRFRGAVDGTVHIARIGGDEFACALIGADGAQAALDIARNLSACLARPFDIDGRAFEIGAAIGIAHSDPGNPKPFTQLIHDADLAMYRAKADQLDKPLVFNASLGLEADARRALEADIEAGLERNEFFVVYQPIARSSDGSTASVEALLRWEHPTRGAVPPDVFIPVAENSKLIRRLGDFVVRSVCEEIGADAPHSVSINLSPAQLTDERLCERYLRELRSHGMTANQIEFELTEAVLVEDFDRAKARLMELHDAGFKVNLDDFGTGFASVGYLHMLPFSKIKIDKSFVQTIGRGEGPNKMLQALALLGDALSLEMVAEGVETEGQAAMLRLLGFEYLQGWHFGHPLPASQLKARSAGKAA
ncbi:putative bifunctional diguanylate cyclase/phosphodiesterase [Maricaulis maris]|uniref:Diguanylate cyclase (GGDEF)-like protein n=1 Tax=Maricaulis maris TaxID=74318 RepID=A0A495D3J5_9PROT|nr:EAL domain-containing protein [Maricaulis maris]RKQ96483.1 diguanylate cyclase (GGDEF)-like protein [Maricaulis maris]